jgi:hypothetical protein
MNAADLRDVFEERSSATSDDIMHDLRLSGVRTRIRRRRRRRVIAWSAAALALLAGAGALALRSGAPPSLTGAWRSPSCPTMRG